ncbi:hypothetical protein Tsp_08977, partial [Trichinella spiralis]|uniref:hypothetical protein n=2 Tax=Trichinella spiralis TaxID=6334 RepID=UPI0001EFC351
VKKGCRGSIHTNLDVDAVLDCNPHADDCTPDNDILYKMEKKNALKRRAAEEMKTVPQIYHEENVTSKLFIIHVFIAGKLVPHVSCLTVHKDLSMYREIFDNLIVKAATLGVVLQLQTVISDFETALIPALQGTFPGVSMQGCYFRFCQAVLRKVTDLGMRTSYINEAATKKKVKMLLATAFLPLHDVAAAVDLFGRDATGSIAALFNYFRMEWMPYDRLPLWNVYNVNIRTNNDLEDWHFKMNRLAGKRHIGFYELLQLLIDEQGSTETLIQQIKNKKYEELQQRITALTAEYDDGTRTLEPFLKVVAYRVPEEENY